MKALVETLVMPPLSLFLLCGSGVLVRRWRPRLGRAMAWGGALTLVALTLPHVAYTLQSSLQTEAVIPPGRTTIDAQAIVVLSADHDADPPEYGHDQPGALTIVRCRYGAALSRRTGVPLLLTGGVLRPDRRPVAAIMNDFVVDELHTPVRWVEKRSRTTRENARFTAELLATDGVERVALVTNAWHMPRARAAFEAAGLDVLPAPCDPCPRPHTTLAGWVPHVSSFQHSVWAIHEWVGRLWYAISG